MLRTEPIGRSGSATAIQRRLADVERTLANPTDTAAKGGAVPAVLEALNRADAERRALVKELAAVKAPRRSATLDDWHALIWGDVTEARGLLDVLLRERITFTAKAGRNGNPVYELRIPIAFNRLFVSLVPGLEAGMSWGGLVDLTGVEPVTS